LRPAVSKEVHNYRGIKCLEYGLTQLSQLSDITVQSKHNGDVSPEKKELYQLRAKVSASYVHVVSRVNSTRMRCTERYGYKKCPAIGALLHSFIVRYNYMHTYRIVQ
jgi:hypothetical protein